MAIIIPESNLPFAAVDLQKEVKYTYRLDNHMFMLEDGGNGRKDLPGSVTTHTKKLEMVQILIDIILFKLELLLIGNLLLVAVL